jgi:hypothetical protein
MSYSSKIHHSPGFSCDLELGFTAPSSTYPNTVVKALGRGCIHPYTISSGGKSHSGQASGYEAADVLATLGRFKDTHHLVEVVPSPSLDRLAPELGALMAAEVAQDAEQILDGLDTSDLRDAAVAAEFETAAEQTVPRFDEA